ncbi:MAG: M23 family metallopeptidase [Conexibacter sp.]
MRAMRILVLVALGAGVAMAFPWVAAGRRPHVTITGGSGVVGAGHAAFLDASVPGAWCRVEVVRGRHHRAGDVQRAPSRHVRIAWKVPRDARSGTYAIGLRCAARAGDVSHGKAAFLHMTVRGGRGSGLPIPLAQVQIGRQAQRVSERLELTDALPPGDGDPSAYQVDLPPGVGGGGFASYWPLSQGVRARITEGPGGSYSHYTIYTHDAVDLGVPSGTELRAGFPGVVARVNRGCVVGDGRCGNGYGNYIYLKASDGTCAVLAHMSQIDVAPGQQVAQYQHLGLSGNTGNSTGAHLHYDRVDCANNRSLPWAPIEGGPLNEGVTITSQNHAGAPPPTTPTPQPTPTPTPTPTPNPSPPPTYGETVGGPTHTWTNWTNAGGTEGPTIASYTTVQIACKLPGFRVADGNTWWYRIASAPWNSQFYASADAFYNNGQTSGSLRGTPFVDPAVRDC